MQGFNVDKTKTLHAALYILNHLGETDSHKIFKILYFADQEHLKQFGRPITGDSYQATKFGPVPSFLYGLFKAAEKGVHPFAEAIEMFTAFSVSRKDNIPHIQATKAADINELAETDLEVITNSIKANKELSFAELVIKSHDIAWINAAKKHDTEISYIDMAIAANTSHVMINHIVLNAENECSKN